MFLAHMFGMHDATKRVLGAALALGTLLVAAGDARARSCSSNPKVPQPMMAFITGMGPHWEDRVTYTPATPSNPWAFPPWAAQDAKWAAAGPIFNEYCVSCHTEFSNPSRVKEMLPKILDRIQRPNGASGRMPRAKQTEWYEGNPNQVPAAKLAAIQGMADFGGPSTGGVSTVYGIRRLFDTTTCQTCHNKQAGAPAENVAAANRYTPCGNCHSGAADSSALTGAKASYPEWLRLDQHTPHQWQSYYQPGSTKAEASLIRTKDGTMPPGAAARDQAAGTEYAQMQMSVGWCDEIITVYQAWIDAGLPN